MTLRVLYNIIMNFMGNTLQGVWIFQISFEFIVLHETLYFTVSLLILCSANSLTDCRRFGSACELSSSSAISEFPSSQHNIRADSPP